MIIDTNGNNKATRLIADIWMPIIIVLISMIRIMDI